MDCIYKTEKKIPLMGNRKEMRSCCKIKNDEI